MNTTTIATLIGTLQEHGVPPDRDYTAAAGKDWGYVAAWRLPKGDYVIWYGDNGQTDYALDDNADDLACWLLPGGDGSDAGEDAPVVIANVRGIAAIKPAGERSEGPFRAVITRYYYGPTEQSSWAYDPYTQQPYEFDTFAEAQAWIEAEEKGDYYLSHNESGSPTYTIVAV